MLRTVPTKRCPYGGAENARQVMPCRPGAVSPMPLIENVLPVVLVRHVLSYIAERATHFTIHILTLSAFF